MTSKRVFFVHIPKCAGTTIDYMMRFQFGIAAMNVRDEPNKGGDHLRQGGNHLAFANSLHPWFRAASGHGLFLSKEIRDRYPDSFWFTILREPRARYLSHFTYLAEKKGLQTKLDDWVGQGNMKNIQTRWLAGEPNLDKAIEAMETLFDFVGRLDRLEDSLAMMARAAGVPFTSPTGYQRNITKGAKPELSDSVKAMIEENNQLDIQLWDYFCANIWPKEEAALGGAKLATHDEITLRDRMNLGLNWFWRGAVYAPALKVRGALA